MPAANVTIADSLKDVIDGATLSQSEYTLERSYAEWDLELEGIDDSALPAADRLFIDVVTHTVSQTVALVARGVLSLLCPIDIAVRKKFSSDDVDPNTGRILTTSVDDLVFLTQELHVLLTKLRTADNFCGVWQTTEILVNPNQDHLRTLRQFTSIIRLVFRADLDLA